MIFLGDVAFPHSDLVFPKLPGSEVCCFNCEGYLVNSESEAAGGVFNSMEAINNLPFDRLVGVIANNHILDIPEGIERSLGLANESRLALTGGGMNLEEASATEVLEERGQEIAIISAGWHVIGCKPAGIASSGVRPLDFKKIEEEIILQKSFNRKVVLFLHWGYELEIYPHPSHRSYAHSCIDSGADLIVGCHAHCIQGFEEYKGCGIFFGIGNAIFKQGYYFNGNLKFPESCKAGLCIDWDANSNSVKIADISLVESKVFLGEFVSPKISDRIRNLSTFTGMSHMQYVNFFKEGRVKRKGLPIFYEQEITLVFRIKEEYVKLRSKLLGFAFKLNLLGYDK